MAHLGQQRLKNKRIQDQDLEDQKNKTNKI